MSEDELNKFRLTIIANIVKKINGPNSILGKKKLQKLIYFLQETKNVPLNYKYEIYHYGPYCFELSGNIDSLEIRGVINIVPEQDGFGYNITPGKHMDSFIGRTSEISKSFDNGTTDLANRFGKFDGLDIELLATLHFADKVMKKRNPAIADEIIINKVKDLKPKYGKEYITNKFEELKEIIKN